ncbi:hypothetical protein BHS06_25380 [Myxococcus xanthus]|uniref:hypothetical protein n=1 Tax=Myxococcus xanthus TaxID=34 RepID=UPI001125BF33|nr:hypothetical protein [Myxococcus xanthus]QDE92041.1 hypothetical protein BHS06_25380 [Myxococcus xanthus]
MARDVVSWEEYQRNAARVVDGQELYIVEWDLALTRDELRDRYDRYVAAASTGQDDSESTGRTESPLRVNRVGTSDDIWTWANRFNLRYCVSNAFGTNKTRIVNELANAAANWEYVADVDFIYASTQDANNGDRRYPAAHTNDYTAALHMGQSFLIPFAVTTNFAEECFLVGNGPTAAHIRYGDGMAGAVLASATSVVNTGVQCGVNSSYTWHRANFPGVALFANSAFTVAFGNGTQTLRMAIHIGNPYTRGNMWDSFGGGRNLSPWDGRVRMGRLGPP